MEMLKKYWYVLVAILALFFMMKKKKTTRRRRTYNPRYNMMRGMRSRYRSYSRGRMTRRRRK